MGGSTSTSNIIDIVNQISQTASNSVWNSNSTTATNIVNNIQELSIEIGPTGVLDCGSGGLNIDQKIKSDTKFIVSFSNTTANEMKTKLGSELQTRTAQITKVIEGFMSSIGGSTDTENITRIQNRVSQVILNSATTQNLSNVLSESVNIQKNKIVINGKVIGQSCNISQDIQVNSFVESLSENIIKSIQDDTILTSIVNDVKSSVDVQKKGIADLFSGLAMLIAVIAVSLIIGGTVIFKGGVKALTNWKFLLTVLGLLILWIVVSYFMVWWPFKKKQKEFWGCNPDTADPSCIKKNDVSTGPYWSKSDCESDIQAGRGICRQYWGCAKDTAGIFTGECKTYTSILDGPFFTKNECISSDKCSVIYGCDIQNGVVQVDASGIGRCVPYNKKDFPAYKDGEGYWSSRPSCANSVAQCRQYWACTDKSKKICESFDQVQGPVIADIYSVVAKTEADCKSRCGV